ncbi:MAG: hypothetical protein ACR2QO_03560 [Acidimicrobiales bacterium]
MTSLLGGSARHNNMSSNGSRKQKRRGFLGYSQGCTLEPGARDARELEWSDLGSLALSTERIEHGIASTFPRELQAQIEDLASRELDCCGSWLNISITIAGEAVRLELTTSSADGRALLDSIAGFDSTAGFDGTEGFDSTAGFES